jgi:hypothetical protein
MRTVRNEQACAFVHRCEFLDIFPLGRPFPVHTPKNQQNFKAISFAVLMHRNTFAAINLFGKGNGPQIFSLSTHFVPERRRRVSGPNQKENKEI